VNDQVCIYVLSGDLINTATVDAKSAVLVRDVLGLACLPYDVSART
jgi:hypothetical protein